MDPIPRLLGPLPFRTCDQPSYPLEGQKNSAAGKRNPTASGRRHWVSRTRHMGSSLLSRMSDCFLSRIRLLTRSPSPKRNGGKPNESTKPRLRSGDVWAATATSHRIVGAPKPSSNMLPSARSLDVDGRIRIHAVPLVISVARLIAKEIRDGRKDLRRPSSTFGQNH
jgi:hypothetical protein